MGLIDTVRNALGPRSSERADPLLPFQEWVNLFSYNGNLYNYGALTTTLTQDHEEIEASFMGRVAGAYKSNGIVWACETARQLLFSEARFQFRELHRGRPGDLFGNTDLLPLEQPWPGGTTADLELRAMVHADLAGTAFMVRQRTEIRCLRPDWVTMVFEGESDLDRNLLGLVWHPDGPNGKLEPEIIDGRNVAVWAPIPDPTGGMRGISWLSAVIPEISSDLAATRHKVKFFEGGATVNLQVQTGVSDPDKFREWVAMFREKHPGAADKTLFLTPGADSKPIGADLAQSDFRDVTTAGETRIAAASGMHPVIVGLSEGLSGSSLNQGNFMAARRLVADKTLRPLWRSFAQSVARIIRVPAGAELWYDDRDIPFLAEDVKDASEVQAKQAATIRTLVDAGYDPDAVIDAVTAGDYERLKGAHTGLFSVQLQPPTTITTPPAPNSEANGQGSSEESNALVSTQG